MADKINVPENLRAEWAKALFGGEFFASLAVTPVLTTHIFPARVGENNKGIEIFVFETQVSTALTRSAGRPELERKVKKIYAKKILTNGPDGNIGSWMAASPAYDVLLAAFGTGDRTSNGTTGHAMFAYHKNQSSERFNLSVPEAADGRDLIRKTIEELSSIQRFADAQHPCIPALRYSRNLVLEGVPGTGKTYVLGDLVEKWTQWMYGKPTGRKLARSLDSTVEADLTNPKLGPGYFLLTMHPATSYEDFVEGLRTPGTSDHAAHATRRYFQESAPSLTTSGRNDGPEVSAVPTSSSAGRANAARPEAGARFEVVDGFFLRVCIEAARHPKLDYLVVLDELNRCNLPKVMGDLLTTLERSKRATHFKVEGPSADWDTKNCAIVTLPVSGRRFFVPDNVYVLATMNTTDRSVTPMDAALRRRFAFHRIWPIGTSVSGASSPEQVLEEFKASWKEMQGDRQAALKVSIAAWARINEKLFEHGPDVLLGHSYLFDMKRDLEEEGANVAEVVEHHWNAHILPQLVDVLVSNDLVADLLPTKEKSEEVLDLSRVGLSDKSIGGFTFTGYLRGKNFAAVPILTAKYAP